MKVGDLVNYRRADWLGIVLKINHTTNPGDPHILIFDIENSMFWDRMSDYEVISESR